MSKFLKIEEYHKVLIVQVGDMSKESVISCLIDNQNQFDSSLIPNISKIYDNLLVWNLISIQPMKSPLDVVYYFSSTYPIVFLKQSKIACITRFVGHDFNDIGSKIDAEILGDLWEASESVKNVDYRDFDWVVVNNSEYVKDLPENYNIYVNNNIPGMLFGKFKPTMNSGYIYCPYLLLSHNESGKIFLRYGKKLVHLDYYKKIEV